MRNRLIALLLLAKPAAALTIAVAVETTTLDPQFYNTTSNTGIARNIFEPLIDQDATMRPIPGLATAWTPVSPTEWDIRLRPNVTFHNGAPLTAADVEFSLRRPATITGSPGSFAPYTRAITAIDITDPLTLHIHTAAPYPLLPIDLSTLQILPRSIAGHDSRAEFDSGQAVIGTGPYRFASWQRGQDLTLARNPAWQGASPAQWDSVIFRPIPEAGPRIAALLAHDADMVESVPTPLVAELAARPGLTLARLVTSRLMYLQFDTTRPQTPDIADAEGHPLPTNPLRDPRIRQAISKAIDRPNLVAHVMDNTGTPAGQILPDGYSDTSPNLPPDPYDPEAARRLLAEAGYPQGFTLTLRGPINRYVNDRALGEALGQMLTRIGIATRFDPMPANLFLAGADNFGFSAFLWGWASETGEASGPLRALLATRDPSRGWGNSNRMRYANPELDRLLGTALTTLDDTRREGMLRQATEVAVHDGGIVPVLFQESIWAMRGELTYTPNPLGYSLAQQVKRK